MGGGLPVMSGDVTSTDVGGEDNVKMGNVLTADSEIPSSNKWKVPHVQGQKEIHVRRIKVSKIAYVNHT